MYRNILKWKNQQFYKLSCVVIKTRQQFFGTAASQPDFFKIGTNTPVLKLLGTTPNFKHIVNKLVITSISGLPTPCRRCSAVMPSFAGAQFSFSCMI